MTSFQLFLFLLWAFGFPVLALLMLSVYDEKQEDKHRKKYERGVEASPHKYDSIFARGYIPILVIWAFGIYFLAFIFIPII